MREYENNKLVSEDDYNREWEGKTKTRAGGSHDKNCRNKRSRDNRKTKMEESTVGMPNYLIRQLNSSKKDIFLQQKV